MPHFIVVIFFWLSICLTVHPFIHLSPSPPHPTEPLSRKHHQIPPAFKQTDICPSSCQTGIPPVTIRSLWTVQMPRRAHRVLAFHWVQLVPTVVWFTATHFISTVHLAVAAYRTLFGKVLWISLGFPLQSPSSFYVLLLFFLQVFLSFVSWPQSGNILDFLVQISTCCNKTDFKIGAATA